MADSDPLGLGELLALFGQSNPFAGIAKSVTQFQRGVTQFLDSVEKFNQTLDELNGVARRVNNLLDAVEQPIQAIVPQVTRTIKTADALVDVLNDLSRRLTPLTQLAESAGSMFGLRSLTSMLPGSSPRPEPAPEQPTPKPETAKPTPAKKAPAKTAAKKTAAKKAPAKKVAPKR
jgi:ABC-type transporter Mla subunit MlaD